MSGKIPTSRNVIMWRQIHISIACNECHRQLDEDEEHVYTSFGSSYCNISCLVAKELGDSRPQSLLDMILRKRRSTV